MLSRPILYSELPSKGQTVSVRLLGDKALAVKPDDHLLELHVQDTVESENRSHKLSSDLHRGVMHEPSTATTYTKKYVNK